VRARGEGRPAGSGRGLGVEPGLSPRRWRRKWPPASQAGGRFAAGPARYFFSAAAGGAPAGFSRENAATLSTMSTSSPSITPP